MISHLRDEYIVKKYIEKRWISTTKLPKIPHHKNYRKQEVGVIDFVSSWKLNGNLKSNRCSSEFLVSSRVSPMRLLKRGETIEKIDHGEFLVTDRSHHGGTFAAIEGIMDKNRTKGDSSLPGIAAEKYCLHEYRDSLDIAIPGLDDFTIPESFRYNIMSPNVKHTNRLSSGTSSSSHSISATDTLSPNTKIDEMDVIILVRDAGIQTDSEFVR